MEENTVLLSLEKYDRLVEAQKKVNEPRKKTVLIESAMFSHYECQTDDEATEKLANELKEAKAELAEAKAKLDKLPKEPTIDDIKKMSWREFKKWKRA
jgi:predicted class III extradiol MEMO1 family dioxygenase